MLLLPALSTDSLLRFRSLSPMDPLALLPPIRSGVSALSKDASRAIHHRLQCATLFTRLTTVLPALSKLEASLGDRHAHSPLDLDLYRNVSNLLQLVDSARSLVQKCCAPAIDFLGKPEDFAFEFRSVGRSLYTIKREIGFTDSSASEVQSQSQLFDEQRDARDAEEDRKNNQNASVASAAAAAAPMWTAAASAAASPGASSYASPSWSASASSASASSSSSRAASAARAKAAKVAASSIPTAPPLGRPAAAGAVKRASARGSAESMVLYTARATALYDCVGTAADELDFKSGQRLRIEGKLDGWFLGFVEGHPDTKGIFPSNFVEIEEKMGAASRSSPSASSSSSSSSSSSASASAARTNATDPAVLASHPNLKPRDGLATAQFSYLAGAGDQLPFKTGDVLVLTGEIEGWFVGRLLEGDGTIGSFPANYVEVMNMD